MKKIILFLVFLLLITFIFISSYKERGTFQELVLDKYKSQNFDIICIEDDELVKHSTKDISKINNFLSKLKEYELIESEYRGKWNDDLQIDSIYLHNYESQETLDIELLDKRYMVIRVKTISIINDIDKKITTYKDEYKSQVYKITNKSIDFNYLEQFFNSLEEVN